MFNNKNSICVCKGIRKCVLCAPESVTKELNGEKDFLFKSNNLFFYCSKCDQSVKVDQLLGKILTDYLDQKITKIPCMCQNRDQNEILKISGIFLQENFISYDEEQFLLSAIDKSKWVESQSGRFKQDFGPKANFKHKKLKCSTFTGLPVYSKFLIQRLQNSSNEKVKTFVPVELCNLRYESSRGACIDPHFDDFWLWGDRLITFNLLENTFLTLTPGKEVNESFGDHQVLVPLSRFSMIVLTDDARFKWMHGIKKSHIKNCRQAITIREITNEFKNAENQGDFLEKLALTFKGISVGTIEDFFNDKNKTENWPHRLCLCDHDLGKVDSYWEKFANLLKNESNNKEFYYNIGKKLAEWTNECQQILPELINEEKIQKSLEIRSVKNFCLISRDFDEYCNLLRDYFSNKSMGPSLKSKIISSVYQVQDSIKSLKLSELLELTNDWFDANKETDEFDDTFSLNKRKIFISLKFDNLALVISKLIFKQSFEMEKIEPILEKLVSGYSSKNFLEPEHLNFINSLTFLNLAFNLPNENFSVQIEKFYLTNF